MRAFPIIILIGLLFFYYITVALHFSGRFKISNEEPKVSNLWIPFYYWFK